MALWEIERDFLVLNRGASITVATIAVTDHMMTNFPNHKSHETRASCRSVFPATSGLRLINGCLLKLTGLIPFRFPGGFDEDGRPSGNRAGTLAIECPMSRYVPKEKWTGARSSLVCDFRL